MISVSGIWVCIHVPMCVHVFIYLYSRELTFNKRLPVPVVWSLSGPVPIVGEAWFVRRQSKSSVATWRKLQSPDSKVQFIAKT